MKPTPSKQKMRGGYYTPPEVSRFITKWGFHGKKIRKILEPSCGDGSFLEPICDCLKKRRRALSPSVICAVEIDPLEAQKASEKFSIHVECRDFFDVAKELIEAKDVDLALGNPPFIRYQHFDKEGREKAFALMEEVKMHPNRLTNIWVPFLVLSAQSLSQKGRLGMVIPAELLQVDYARECRDFLIRFFGKITIITFKELLFADAQQEVVIILAERIPDSIGAEIGFVELNNPKDLASLDLDNYPFERYRSSPTGEKWTRFLLPPDELAAIEKALEKDSILPTSHYFETNVGVVSGENRFFLLSSSDIEKHNLQDSIRPIVSKTDQLKGIVFSEDDYRKRFHEEKKMNIFAIDPESTEKPTIDQSKYISYGEALGVNTNYKCRIRKKWYAVPLSWAPTGFALRQVGYFPRIIVNETSATSTDTIHKLRFHDTADAHKIAAAFINSLTFAFAEITGRSYGGGVLTFEPSEIRKLVIPSKGWDQLDPAHVDALLRKNAIEEALDYTDKILLINALGMDKKEVALLRNAWRRLSDRRLRRKRSEI